MSPSPDRPGGVEAPCRKRRLILFRHGKSDWDASYGTDHERPLAPRGIEAAKTMGRLLARSGQLPDLVVTSTALRARTTVELAAAAGSWEAPVEECRELYHAGPEEVIARIHAVADSVRTLLVAGHEPACADLTAGLIGKGRGIRFPTAAMARIDLRVPSWRDARPGAGELVWLLQPKFFTRGAFPELLGE